MLSRLQNRDTRFAWLMWLLLIVLVLLVLIAIPVFLDYRSKAIGMVLEVDRQVTHLSAVRVREELAEFPNDLVELARTDKIMSQNPVTQTEALRNAVPIREGVFDGGLVLLDHFGTVVASEPERTEIVNDDWSDREYFRQLLSSSPSTVYFSNAVTDGPNGAQVVAVSVPVLGSDGRFTGALVGMLRLGQSTVSPFYANIVRLRIGDNATTYLVDGKSKILFDSGSAQEGDEYITHKLPGSGDADDTDVIHTQDEQGRDLLISHAPIPGTTWTLVIEQDWNRLVGPTLRHVDFLMVLLSLAAILPAIGIVVMMRKRDVQMKEHDSAVHEAHLARQLVLSLLPEDAPILPGWDIAVHCEPAEVVGGAYYDFVLRSDGCLMLAFGDVGADGVPAGLTLAILRTILRAAARENSAPAAALQQSNELLSPDLPLGVAVTCIYTLLDPANGELCIGNAGHAPPLWVHKSVVDEIGNPDNALALQFNSRYTETGVTLLSGDCVLFYSHALLTAKNSEGEEFGLARMKDAAIGHTKEPCDLIEAVVMAVREFVGGKWTPDRDVTLIALQRLPMHAPG